MEKVFLVDAIKNPSKMEEVKEKLKLGWKVKSVTPSSEYHNNEFKANSVFFLIVLES